MQTTFLFVKAGDGSLAKQGQAILNIIEARGKISKADLLSQIQLDVKSRQRAQRLLSYYKSQLVSRGYIEERKHG